MSGLFVYLGCLLAVAGFSRLVYRRVAEQSRLLGYHDGRLAMIQEMLADGKTAKTAMERAFLTRLAVNAAKREGETEGGETMH